MMYFGDMAQFSEPSDETRTATINHHFCEAILELENGVSTLMGNDVFAKLIDNTPLLSPFYGC